MYYNYWSLKTLYENIIINRVDLKFIFNNHYHTLSHNKRLAPPGFDGFLLSISCTCCWYSNILCSWRGLSRLAAVLASKFLVLFSTFDTYSDIISFSTLICSISFCNSLELMIDFLFTLPWWFRLETILEIEVSFDIGAFYKVELFGLVVTGLFEFFRRLSCSMATAKYYLLNGFSFTFYFLPFGGPRLVCFGFFL